MQNRKGKKRDVKEVIWLLSMLIAFIPTFVLFVVVCFTHTISIIQMIVVGIFIVGGSVGAFVSAYLMTPKVTKNQKQDHIKSIKIIKHFDSEWD